MKSTGISSILPRQVWAPVKPLIGNFLVKPYDSEENRLIEAPICVVEVDGSGPGGCVIKIPSRHEWSNETGEEFDREGEYFTSFIFQFLNTLQDAKLISLPGHLPVA